jgi:ABC-type branched-subunit amino acid transport system ATPase component
VVEPTSGRISLDGDDITKLAPHQRVRRGIVRTFQINQLWNELTPLQSLRPAVSAQLGISHTLVEAAGQRRAGGRALRGSAASSSASTM